MSKVLYIATWNPFTTGGGAQATRSYLDAILDIFGANNVDVIMGTAKVKPEHGDVIRRWLDFSQKHRETLLKGDFRPHHPENGYTWLEGESENELLIAGYADDALATVRTAEKPLVLVNATGTPAMLVELPKRPSAVRAFDVLGRPVETPVPPAGISRVRVPMSGHMEIVW